MELKRVVVTGIGAVSALGNDAKTTWSNIVSGQSGAARITKFDPTLFKTQFACEVKNFDVSALIDRKELRSMDIHSQYAVAAADEAIKDSGINLESADKTRIGVIIGSGIGGVTNFQHEVQAYDICKEQGPKFNPFFIIKTIVSMSAGNISIKYGLQGPNYATSSACASSSHALSDAFNLIRLGKADVMLGGGAEAAICECTVGGFNSMHALSTRNDSPETASRPFSKSRDGFVLGEGSAILVLEELEHAKARGAKIYAEMVGAGMTADAHHISAPHPEGLGAKRVMQEALDDAGLRPEDIDYINVHGTSTGLGDIAEIKAIKEVFGESAYKLNISSTKSMTGHLLGGAGALEAMFAVLAIKDGIVPPTINHAEGDEDEEIDYGLNYTFNKAQKREIHAAISNTFGFGGHNACVAFKKYV